jgi:hypothetical protein
MVDMKETVGVAFGEIDPGKVADVRGRVPAINHRRSIGGAAIR